MRNDSIYRDNSFGEFLRLDDDIILYHHIPAVDLLPPSAFLLYKYYIKYFLALY